MKTVRIACWAWLATLLCVGTADAIVLNFDDLGSDGLGEIPDGYGGLDWDEFGWIDGAHQYDGNSGYYAARVSGDNVAFNWYAKVGTVSERKFDFIGGWFTGAWRNDLDIDIVGYRDNIQVYSTTFRVSATAPSYFLAGYEGIDELEFESYGGTPHPDYGKPEVHFGMDDFEYRLSDVPEPGTLTVLGLGLLGLGLIRRRARPRL